jgi:BirA family biotin operon repressor/biotin-[acetyl-CoA-carboxylase] ligase
MHANDFLHHYPFITSVIYEPVMASTNQTAIDACRAGSIGDGAVVITDFQTQGRGRRGQRWESLPGEDVLMSWVVSPTCPIAAWPRLGFVVGLAIRDAIQHQLPNGPRVELKWPNDILIDHRKCAGILIETVKKRNLAVVGVGINIAHNHYSRSSLREWHPNKGVGGNGFLMNRWGVIHTVISAIGERLNDIRKGRVPFLEWNDNAAYLGRFVSINNHERRFDGRFLGINHEGAAILEINGRHHSIADGDRFRCQEAIGQADV